MRLDTVAWTLDGMRNGGHSLDETLAYASRCMDQADGIAAESDVVTVQRGDVRVISVPVEDRPRFFRWLR